VSSTERGQGIRAGIGIKIIEGDDNRAATQVGSKGDGIGTIRIVGGNDSLAQRDQTIGPW
jgi:hypothetical protein